MRFDFRNILSTPGIYRLFKGLVGRDKSRKTYVDRHIRPKEGNRILDIGCGPGDILHYLPPVEYVGFDMNAEYIAAAKKRYSNRGSFFCKKVSEETIDDPSSFDIVLANGIIHHLNDDEAMQLLNLARLCLKPTGRLVTFDGCYTEEQSRVARILLSRDRGRFVRTAEGYIDLASKAFPDVKVYIYHNHIRIPYTHIIMECSPLPLN